MVAKRAAAKNDWLHLAKQSFANLWLRLITYVLHFDLNAINVSAPGGRLDVSSGRQAQ